MTNLYMVASKSGKIPSWQGLPAFSGLRGYGEADMAKLGRAIKQFGEMASAQLEGHTDGGPWAAIATDEGEYKIVCAASDNLSSRSARAGPMEEEEDVYDLVACLHIKTDANA
jgi:hypothetical protein